MGQTVDTPIGESKESVGNEGSLVACGADHHDNFGSCHGKIGAKHTELSGVVV